jgi:hypothetical protein
LTPPKGGGEVGDVAVDADRAGADPLGDGGAAFGVGGPDRAAEAEVRVVGDADGVDVVVRDEGQDGAEDLLLGDDGTVVDVGEDRRLDEPAPVQAFGAAATGGEAGAFALAIGDVRLHALALAGGGHRPDLGARVGGVAHGQ